MRTNIVIDDTLMKKVMKLGHYKTKKAAVEEGLRLIVLLKQQSAIRKMRGKLHWEGSLEQMRLDN